MSIDYYNTGNTVLKDHIKIFKYFVDQSIASNHTCLHARWTPHSTAVL